MIIKVVVAGYEDKIDIIQSSLERKPKLVQIIPAYLEKGEHHPEKIITLGTIVKVETEVNDIPDIQPPFSYTLYYLHIECDDNIGKLLANSGATYKLTPHFTGNNLDFIVCDTLPIARKKEKKFPVPVVPEKVKKEFLDKNPEGTLFYTYGTLAGEILTEICKKANDLSTLKAFSQIYHSLTKKINMLEKHEVSDPYIYSLLTKTAREAVSRLFGDKIYASYAHNCIQGALKKHNEKSKLISYRQAEQKVLGELRKRYKPDNAILRIIGVQTEKWGWIFSYEALNEHKHHFYFYGTYPYYVHKNGFMMNWETLHRDWTDKNDHGLPTPDQLNTFFISKAIEKK